MIARLLIALLLAAASTANASDGYNFTPQQRDEAIQKAIDGDSYASSNLSFYFGELLGDATESRFWLKLSAEQGLCNAIVAQADLMEYQRKPEQAAKWADFGKARDCGADDEFFRSEIRRLGTKVEAQGPASAPTPADGPVPHDFSSTFDLSPAALESTRQAAVRGDGRASARMSDYYLFGYNQVEEGWFWMHLAAEQGDCPSLVGYIGQLEGPMRRPDLVAPWLERASKWGCDHDARLKEDLDGVRERLASRPSPPEVRVDAVGTQIELAPLTNRARPGLLDVKALRTSKDLCVFVGTYNFPEHEKPVPDVLVAIERSEPRCHWRKDAAYTLGFEVDPAQAETVLRLRRTLLPALDAWSDKLPERELKQLRYLITRGDLPNSLFGKGKGTELSYQAMGMEVTVAVKFDGQKLVITRIGFAEIN